MLPPRCVNMEFLPWVCDWCKSPWMLLSVQIWTLFMCMHSIHFLILNCLFVLDHKISAASRWQTVKQVTPSVLDTTWQPFVLIQGTGGSVMMRSVFVYLVTTSVKAFSQVYIIARNMRAVRRLHMCWSTTLGSSAATLHKNLHCSASSRSFIYFT